MEAVRRGVGTHAATWVFSRRDVRLFPATSFCRGNSPSCKRSAVVSLFRQRRRLRRPFTWHGNQDRRVSCIARVYRARAVVVLLLSGGFQRRAGRGSTPIRFGS